MIDLSDDIGDAPEPIFAIDDVFDSGTQFLTAIRIDTDNFPVRRPELLAPEFGTGPGVAFKLFDSLRNVFVPLHLEEQQLGVVPPEGIGRLDGHPGMGLREMRIRVCHAVLTMGKPVVQIMWSGHTVAGSRLTT